MEMETHSVYSDRDVTRQSSGETVPTKTNFFFHSQITNQNKKQKRETGMEHKIHQACPLEPGSSFPIAASVRLTRPLLRELMELHSESRRLNPKFPTTRGRRAQPATRTADPKTVRGKFLRQEVASLSTFVSIPPLSCPRTRQAGSTRADRKGWVLKREGTKDKGENEQCASKACARLEQARSARPLKYGRRAALSWGSIIN